MIKKVTHAYLGPIGYHSEPRCPLFPKSVSWLGPFLSIITKKKALFIWFQTHLIPGHLKKDFRPTTIKFWETFVQGDQMSWNQMSWDQLCLGLNEAQPSIHKAST